MSRCAAVTHVSGYLLLLLSGYKNLIVNKPLGSKFWPLPSFSGTLPTTECAARQTSEQRAAALSKAVTKYSDNHAQCTWQLRVHRIKSTALRLL